jgi:hypothetical protein
MAQGRVVLMRWRDRFEGGGSILLSRGQKKLQLGDSEWRRWVRGLWYCSKVVVYGLGGGALRC